MYCIIRGGRHCKGSVCKVLQEETHCFGQSNGHPLIAGCSMFMIEAWLCRSRSNLDPALCLEFRGQKADTNFWHQLVLNAHFQLFVLGMSWKPCTSWWYVYWPSVQCTLNVNTHGDTPVHCHAVPPNSDSFKTCGWLSVIEDAHHYPYMWILHDIPSGWKTWITAHGFCGKTCHHTFWRNHQC